MAVHIAVIGLDRVSISAALTLSGKHTDIKCSGWDPDAEKRIAADHYKTFNPLCKKLKDALSEAVLVILSLPPEELKKVLNEIKDLIAPGTVLVNMSNLQVLPAEMAAQALGSNVNFFSMLPGLKPDDTDISESEANSAAAGLFTDGMIYISAPTQAPAVMLDLAVDLAVLLGGQPMFADAHEVDGLAAANLLLPEITAAALMETAAGQPSWQEGGQLAGHAMARGTAALTGKPGTEWAQVLLANHENVTRLIDEMAAALKRAKTAIQTEDADALQKILEYSMADRAEWLERKGQPVKGRDRAARISSEKQALERILKLGK